MIKNNVGQVIRYVCKVVILGVCDIGHQSESYCHYADLFSVLVGGVSLKSLE